MSIRRIILGLLFSASAVSVICQDTDSTKQVLTRNQKRAEKVEQGKFMAFPFAAPAYTPELGPTLGSNFFNSIISTYWFEDKMRIFGKFRFRNTPDHYWGVAYDNASSYPEKDESNAYTRAHWKINPMLLWQFRKSFFLGLNVDYNWTKASDVNPDMEADPYYVK